MKQQISDILSDSALQKALTGLSKANARVFRWRSIIADHCNEKYGYDPADVDNDEFIDMCDGGCGLASGIKVSHFKATMMGERDYAIELGLIKADRPIL